MKRSKAAGEHLENLSPKSRQPTVCRGWEADGGGGGGGEGGK